MIAGIDAIRVGGAPLLRAAWMIALALTVSEPASAQSASEHGGGRTAAQWLQTIQDAAQRLNYSGTIVYQRGSDVRASRLVHYFDGAVVHERLQMLDGRPLEFIRRDNVVQCLIPEARRIVVEERRGGDAFPVLTSAAPADILAHYDLRHGEVARVADRDCQILHLEPRDALRYGYRLWVDLTSGLLLKSQTLNDAQQVIEQITFTEVRIGEVGDPARLQPSWSTEGWQIERKDASPADLARAGWAIRVPEGYRALSAVHRLLKGRPAVQAVYTDGLATFSVFIESIVGEPPNESTMQRGPVNAVARRIGDAFVTVVGEVPASTVRSVAVAPRQPR
jgi:sigma-E factor negative regulatory protein RseB